MSSIHANSTDSFRYPGWIACKDAVVFRCPGKFDTTQFHHELIDYFLDLFFSKGVLF